MHKFSMSEEITTRVVARVGRQRRRSRLALTLAEREVISRGVTAHQTKRALTIE